MRTLRKRQSRPRSEVPPTVYNDEPIDEDPFAYFISPADGPDTFINSHLTADIDDEQRSRSSLPTSRESHTTLSATTNQTSATARVRKRIGRVDSRYSRLRATFNTTIYAPIVELPLVLSSPFSIPIPETRHRTSQSRSLPSPFRGRGTIQNYPNLHVMTSSPASPNSPASHYSPESPDSQRRPYTSESLSPPRRDIRNIRSSSPQWATRSPSGSNDPSPSLIVTLRIRPDQLKQLLRDQKTRTKPTQSPWGATPGREIQAPAAPRLPSSPPPPYSPDLPRSPCSPGSPHPSRSPILSEPPASQPRGRKVGRNSSSYRVSNYSRGPRRPRVWQAPSDDIFPIFEEHEVIGLGIGIAL